MYGLNLLSKIESDYLTDDKMSIKLSQLQK